MSKKLSKPIKGRLEKLLANTGDMALKRRAKRIIEELYPKDGEKILDVGCGDGFYLHLLSNLGLKLKLTGTDFDKSGLRSARKNLRRKRIPLVEADLMKGLPFKNGSFDKVVMSEVAEHLPNDLKGLREVYRILKPGGITVITVPNHNYPLFWDPVNWVLERVFHTHIKSGFWAGIWNQHLRLYKPESVKKIVEDAGFKLVTCQMLTGWYFPFNHYLVNFAARLFYSGKLPKKLAGDFDKFKNTKETIFGKTLFFLVNVLDYLNDLFPGKSGVSIFIKATK